ncbi:MAG TPA: hypothetical protein VF247_00870 [Candidatus Krumholzibacteria bacterium]
MTPRIPGHKIKLAFTIAAAADLVSILLALAPPMQWAVDLAAAAALFIVLGRNRLLLPGLIMEAIPGLYIFPFWVLVVAIIAVRGALPGQRPTSSDDLKS